MNHRERSRDGSRLDALAVRLARFDRLVEVGVGVRTGVAARLAEGATVTATDIHTRDVPPGVTFVRDDITDPRPNVYAGAEAIYALNLPRELHRPALEVARAVDAAFLFTTLGGDFPAIAAEPETLPDETLFLATDREQTGERTGVYT